MKEDKYNGIRGWLLIFTVILTLLVPLEMVGAALIEISMVFALKNRFPVFSTMIGALAVLRITLAAYCVFAGIRLSKKKRSALNHAKQALLLIPVIALVSTFLPTLGDLPHWSTRAWFHNNSSQVISACVFFTIWYSYLTISKRVKGTFRSPDSLAYEMPKPPESAPDRG